MTHFIILISISVLFVFVLFAILYFFIRKNKKQGFLARGMNLSLFLITLPQEIKKEQEECSLEEQLKVAEQFYSSLAGIKEKKKILNFLTGSPSFVFEIVVHRIGEEIYFYVACPRSLSDLMEKQILGFWPKAQIRPTTDYNIFNPDGVSMGTEAVLTELQVLPLKTYKDFEIDPLSLITSVLTKLEREKEGATIQISIRSSKSPLKKMARRVIDLTKEGIDIKSALAKAKFGFFQQLIEAFFPPQEVKGKEGREVQQSRLNPADEKVISAISEKFSQPLFDVNLRLLCSAEDKIRAQTILEQLENSFEQFNSPILNKLKFRKLTGKLSSKKRLEKLFYYFSFRIFNESKSIVLSSGELASIFHFPTSLLLAPNIKWLKAKEASSPVNLPEQGLILGKNIFRGEEKIVRALEKDRARHFYVIGQTGTGKSVLLKEMIRQDIENGQGVVLIDPHGDLAEDVLSLIPLNRAEDVIYLNPSDTEKPLGLNMLEYDPRRPEAKTFIVNELIEIFEKLYNLKDNGFGGPIFEQYMRNALLLVMEDPSSGNTLVEIPKVLADVAFRKFKLSRCKNVVVKNFWEQEAEKAGGEASLANMVPYITSKMNIFIANDLVRPIISQQHSSFNFREIMDTGKILIVNLSKGKIGDINSYLLGMIVVGKILIAAFSRADIPEAERKNFYLYIDEFHNVTTKTITGVLAEARKYKLNMTFGHQFIGQLDDDTRKAIFGNVGSMLAFRVGPEDAKYLVTEYEPVFDENDLVNFDNYNAGLRLLINGETSKPFNIVTYPPSKGNPRVAHLIKEFSRTKYGRDRAMVETELYDRIKTAGHGLNP
jgi:hypothetical protein